MTLIIFLISFSLSGFAGQSDSEVLTKPVFSSGIEGPATDGQGDLYLVNYQKDGTIGFIANGKADVELFLSLPDGSVGNGIQFLNDSIFYVADYTNHNILRVNKYSKEIDVYAHNDSMTQPNDLAISGMGYLYASDPNWGDSTGQLWLIDKAGNSILLEKGMGTTNGVEVSPDNKYLYVNESIQGKVWKYSILKNGMVSEKKLFYRFQEFGMDGMRCDLNGNLYVARYGKGTVAVLSPEGKLINEIKLQGKKPTNVAFSPSYRKLYITMQEKKWVELCEFE